MKLHRFLPALCCLVGTAQAQWFQTTYALKGGWNAIYLHGDATYATPDILFPDSGQSAGVIEVWRWNPKPNQVQFTKSPLIPSSGTPEWNVWKRGLPAQSNLSHIPGQTAYLVRCSGNASTNWSVPITQKALPPSATWVRSGANLLGFPTKSSPTYPSFSTYFQSFPAATAADAKIYKYVGGDLAAANPLQIFSATAEQVDRNKAYWFEAEVVGTYFAPLDISLSQETGLDFGRTGSVITARLRNTTSANMVITMTPVGSHPAPAGQDAVTASVPLTRRTFDAATSTWTETPIPEAGYTEVIGANSTVELSFGVNRAGMRGPSNTLYASLLRFTDSGNLFDINLPASARVSSLAGLWVGDATVTNVSSQVQSVATARAVLTNGVLTGIEVTGGGFGYGTAPVPIIASPEGVPATATATISEKDGDVTALTLTNPGSGYVLAPVVTFSAPATSAKATAVATVKDGLLTGLAITHPGSGYSAPPTVTIATPPASKVQAVATANVADGALTGVSVTNPGTGYFTSPSVTVAPPDTGITAEAVAEVKNGGVIGVTLITPGTGYTTAPTLTIAAPPPRTTASATAVAQNGKVTGFSITDGGSGYLAAPAITIPNPVAPGTATARNPPLRIILHVDDAGNARLLSQVFVGKLAASGSTGLCTKESLLSAPDKARASRLVAAHLPLDRILSSGRGSVALGQTLVRTVTIPFDDDTNPFIHVYHPDHNNKDARGFPVGAGVESYGITRTLNFQFTTTPPPGGGATGWGSMAIGGNYTEVIRGLHKQDLMVSGSFILRRASEIGTLITQ